MSEVIAKSPGANEFVACEASAGEKWLREARDGGVQKMYADFLSTFGHRCLREVRTEENELNNKSIMDVSHSQFDLLGVPWGDDATPLVKTLQATVAGILAARGANTESGRVEKRARTLEEKLDAFSKPLKEERR